MKTNVELKDGWSLKKAGEDREWLPVRNMPAQVQDILYDHGLLSEEFRLGWCEKALFIGESDWIYRCCFAGEKGRKCRLFFGGLDTVADIWLNGRKLGRSEDFYLPAEFEVSDFLEENNTLYLHFISPISYMREQEWKEKWNGSVLRCKTVRKPIHDFPPEKMEKGSSYQGAVPYFTPVGVYAPVSLVYYEEEEIKEDFIQARVEADGRGVLSIEMRGTGRPDHLTVHWNFPSEDGNGTPGRCKMQSFGPEVNGYGWSIREEIEVEDPPLWWPRGFGRQNLADICIELWKNGKVCDRLLKRAGFRSVEMDVPFAYRINGKKVRLFGGSLDPLQGYTHCYQPEREQRLFEMVENANMNTLRIWGEGIPLPDAFYDECDRRGILVWQEFFLGHGAYPDSQKIRELCKKEAEFLVRRLRHHPSLLLWCGGNETLMGAEFQGCCPYGKEIFLEDFPEIAQRLDKDRYYHPNSPYGGEWANDPRAGDLHTYDCVWEYPYKSYPNFISEHIRTAPPVKHSLEKMIHGDIWPKGFTGLVLDGSSNSMPDTWLERSHISAQGQRKTGDYWEFYDAENADDLIYRFGAAYGKEIRRYGEQVRIGSREPEVYSGRSKGYFACKLVDTWPKVYCAAIDFFQEGYIPYYSLKRVFSPVLLCFQKEESIRLWCVNDSGEEAAGSVRYGLFHIVSGQIQKVKEKKISVPQGDAVLLDDLADFRFFSKDCALFAVLCDEKGNEVSVCIDYVDIERHLKFPNAGLKLEMRGDELVITADRFARCVQITGEQDGDPFGWLFSDNYFDMLPGQRKTVKILGNKEYGTICVKAQYGGCEKIRYNREDKTDGTNFTAERLETAGTGQQGTGHRKNAVPGP
ncbi:MAG: beta-mannosidase [Blautia sp.]|uniref:beta-mannosidase n=1 Tax=unclassified Blautia TaxID=2648079 RepID=UPI001FD00B60|nr:glycoside hydrolase family 2 protein [Blautia sp. NSJ-175]MCJ7845394.1 beta-galactosidase [Blautia sp. NSJ-175]